MNMPKFKTFDEQVAHQQVIGTYTTDTDEGQVRINYFGDITLLSMLDGKAKDIPNDWLDKLYSHETDFTIGTATIKLS